MQKTPPKAKKPTAFTMTLYRTELLPHFKVYVDETSKKMQGYYSSHTITCVVNGHIFGALNLLLCTC